MAQQGSASNTIEFQILFQAVQAIGQLDQMRQAGMGLDQQILAAKQHALELSEAFGISGQAAVGVLKQTQTMITETGSSIQAFGTYSKAAWGQVSADVKTATNDMSALEHGIDFVRVALGTLSAMLIFQVVQAVISTFTTAINLAEQYAESLYKIQVAQDILAKSGIGIKQQDLLDIASSVSQQFGVFSNVEMQTAVSNAALLTREFGFTKDQISQVVQIGSALAIQQGDLKNVSTYIEQVTRALTSGTAPAALSKLGIDITSQQVKDLAAQLYGANVALTDQEKAAITLQIAYQHMNNEIKDFTSFQDTLPGEIAKTNSAWQNFLTILGNMFAPTLLSVQKVVQETIGFMQTLAAAVIVTTSSMTAAIFVLNEVVHGQITNLDQLREEFVRITAESALQKGFDMTASTIADGFKAVASGADTATQAVDKLNTSFKALDASNLDSIIGSVNSFSNQLDKLNQRFQTQSAQDWQDYQTKLARSQQDYQISVANTIADYNARRANAEQTYRNNQIDAEAKFQEQMRQLREKYLFDLEDALRNRDARQVLRLQAQFQMQSTNLTNQFHLEQEQRQRQYQQELADAKRQEQLKLQQMAQAEALKQQRMTDDYNTEKARKQAQYNQELTDLQQSWTDKISMETQKLVEQYGLNDTQAKAVFDLLNSYYGPNGKIDGLYSYSYDSLVARSKALLQALNTMLQQFQAVANSTANFVAPGTATGSIAKYKAKGGIDIVNTPTNTPYGATYGEAGPEAHIFLPLSGGLSSISAPNVNLGSGAGGKIGIEVTLSPDLVSRITENTLNKSADIITRVIRSK